MKRGYEENARVDEGVNEHGIRTILHFEGDTLIVQRTYDANPHLDFARAMREAQEGQSWGNAMRHVGRIPMAEYAKFLAMDPDDRDRAAKQWLREHDQYVTFPKYLKG
jgi:hypothetical protein